MSDEPKQDASKVIMFNPFNLWKNMYFASENAMTAITRKAVETTVFANNIDFILNNYLQFLKMQNELTDYLAEVMPFSSHRDAARVAKMIVSLENKVDNLEDEFFAELYHLKGDTAAILEGLNLMPEDSASEAGAGLLEKLDKQTDSTKELLKKVMALETMMEEISASLSELKVKPKPKTTTRKKKTTPE